MLYYHERFPNNLSAIQMYIPRPNTYLPEGVYAFLELYCCNPKCDCREVKIEIMPQSAKDLGYFETHATPMATLTYAWDLPLSDHNPYFHEKDSQSEWADAARFIFVDYVQEMPEYNVELATRSSLMRMKQNSKKIKIQKQASPLLKDVPKLGRNELCICGSGKKYKKCCLGK